MNGSEIDSTVHGVGICLKPTQSVHGYIWLASGSALKRPVFVRAVVRKKPSLDAVRALHVMLLPWSARSVNVKEIVKP